ELSHMAWAGCGADAQKLKRRAVDHTPSRSLRAAVTAEECERLAAELGIASVTDFLGYREDVDALLADVDVAVLVSWKEGMSKALLEPMAAGIPAVSWDVKGNGEL